MYEGSFGHNTATRFLKGCIQHDFVEAEAGDQADSAVPDAEPLPETLTEDQTIWFDAISEGNVLEVKELLDSGSDSAWRNKVCLCYMMQASEIRSICIYVYHTNSVLARLACL